MTYGDKRDFRKIDIFIGAYGKWRYAASTTWARTCKEARERYANKHGMCLGNIRANFSR